MRGEERKDHRFKSKRNVGIFTQWLNPFRKDGKTLLLRSVFLFFYEIFRSQVYGVERQMSTSIIVPIPLRCNKTFFFFYTRVKTIAGY